MLRALLLVSLLFATNAMATETLKLVFTYENKKIADLIDQFEAESGISIDRLWKEQGDLKVSLLELIERGNAPDVVLIPSDHVGLYKPMGYSAISPADFSNDIPDELWLSATSDGTVYGAPVIQGNQLMLYYNRQLVSEPAATWTDLREQKASFDVPGAELIAWNFDEMYFFMPFFGAFGGWPIMEGQLTLGSDAMMQALDFYQQLRLDKIVDPNCDYNCAMNLFKNGKLAYTINGDWALDEFQNVLGNNLGIAKIPAIADDKPARPMFSTHVLAFPNKSYDGPKKQTLIQFVNYMQSPEVQKSLWQNMQVLPVETSAYAFALANTRDYQNELLQTLTYARSMPGDSAMTFAWSAMRKGYLRHKAGILSSRDAAYLMQELAEKQLENY